MVPNQDSPPCLCLPCSALLCMLRPAGFCPFPQDRLMQRHGLEARLLIGVARAIGRLKVQKPESKPQKGTTESSSSWLLPCRNVGLCCQIF